MSIQKDEVQSKRFDKGTSFGQKRKAGQKSIEVPQKNLRLSGDFHHFRWISIFYRERKTLTFCNGGS